MRPAPAADALLLPHMHVDRRVCAACSFEPAVALAWAHAADVSAVRTGRAKGCCSKYAFEKAEKAWRSLPLSNLPRAPAAAGTCPLHAQAVTGTLPEAFKYAHDHASAPASGTFAARTRRTSTSSTRKLQTCSLSSSAQALPPDRPLYGSTPPSTAAIMPFHQVRQRSSATGGFG